MAVLFEYMYNLIKKGRILGTVMFRHTDFIFVLNRFLENHKAKQINHLEIFFTHIYEIVSFLV